MALGKLYKDIGLPPLDAAFDRAMICGSPALMEEMKTMLLAKGLTKGNHGEPGQFVIEKAFAERGASLGMSSAYAALFT